MNAPVGVSLSTIKPKTASEPHAGAGFLSNVQNSVRSAWWAFNRRAGLGCVTRKQRSALLRHGIDSKHPDFERFYRAGLLSQANPEVVSAAHGYQRQVLGRTLDAGLHVAYANLHGDQEVRLLPRSFYWYELFPKLNDAEFRACYSDKNLYALLAQHLKQPKTLFRRVAGTYFDEHLNPTAPTAPLTDVLGTSGHFIVKPSRTDNGQSIALFSLTPDGGILDGEVFSTVSDIGERYGSDFLIQERIEQHPVLAEPHPQSVNTLRILTLRWGGACHFLLAFMRFGTFGTVNDNAGTGGICVGVDDNGRLQDFAVTEKIQKIRHHPSTGYDFATRAEVPAFSEAVQMCVDGHRSVLHHNLVSWDVAIDKAGHPTFIEYNFRGALWLYQLATKRPVLGEFTEDVLRSVR